MKYWYKYLLAAGQNVLHFLYPRVCEGCGKVLVQQEQVLCIECVVSLPRTSYHHISGNETAQRFAGRIPFLHASSFAYFIKDGLLQRLLHGLKYRNKLDTGKFLGRLSAQELAHTSWIKEIDLIVPVPLFHSKEQKRGYNQCMLIATAMGQYLNLPVSDRSVQRVRNTNTQTYLNREERADNMLQAFRVIDSAALENRHILIIDDVLTTGATLESLGNCLLTIPGVTISIMTIGIASS